jgi:HEPN domain-containing protein
LPRCASASKRASTLTKAVLKQLLAIPKTHDLDRILTLLLPAEGAIDVLRRDAHTLNRFAVEYRYPGLKAGSRKSRSALSAAERVRAEVRRRLKLRP